MLLLRMISRTLYQSPIGQLLLVAKGDYITDLILANKVDAYPHRYPKNNSSVLTTLQHQLDEYFTGKRHSFAIAINPQHSIFQSKVLAAVQKIAYGSTASYGEIAQQILQPKAARAVGMANARNRIPLLIPCHRVIGTNGKLTGFGGGVAIKQQLLQLESNYL